MNQAFLAGFVDELVKIAEAQITFPRHEHRALRRRLDRGQTISTTRVQRELGKYRPGQVLTTPWGRRVRVEERHQIHDLNLHPHFHDLTPAQKRLLGREKKMEVFTLKGID